MLKTRVIPCLLLKNGGLVKTIKFKNPKYVGDPINAIRIFNDKGVDELILLDITATIEGRKPPFKLISEIASECFMPLGYGGGIRDLKDIKEIFSLGVEKVIINTYALENPYFIKEASDLYGSQSIVVSIDVKKVFGGKYKVFIQNGRKKTLLNPIEFAIQMEKMGAGEIFLNSIDRDGTMKGYDIELVKMVAQSVNIPLIACGGADKVSDFFDAVKCGASGVSAGSMFVFHGKHRAVLINVPNEKELQILYKS